MRIKTIALLCVGLFIELCGGSLEARDSISTNQHALNTTVCSIVRKARASDGKLATFRSNVRTGLETFTANDSACEESIWLEYADDNMQSEGKEKQHVTLLKDEMLVKFQETLGEEEDSPDHPCKTMHCMRYDVTATITGRVDYQPTQCKKIRSSNKSSAFQCGYGHMGQWPVRVVIQAVSNVVAVPRH